MPEFLALEPDEAAAMVQVVQVDSEMADVSWCTGTFLATHWVLTAKHCINESLGTFQVRAVDANATVLEEVRVTKIVLHGELDLALLRVEVPLDGVAPVSLVAAIPPDLVGRLVQLAGTGRSESAGPGRRLFSVAEVRELGEYSLSVSADSYAGACEGDSGGAALIRTDDGAVALLGVLSMGSVSCWGEDDYTRVDAAYDWLLSNIGQEFAGTRRCGTLEAKGRCFGALAVWCEAGSVRAERCAGNIVCGWDENASGYRCVTDADVCHGADEFGICRNGDAVRCVEGKVFRNACSDCGATCARSPRTGNVTCTAAPDNDSQVVHPSEDGGG